MDEENSLVIFSPIIVSLYTCAGHGRRYVTANSGNAHAHVVCSVARGEFLSRPVTTEAFLGNIYSTCVCVF